jgi:hypothetical protein
LGFDPNELGMGSSEFPEQRPNKISATDMGEDAELETAAKAAVSI